MSVIISIPEIVERHLTEQVDFKLQFLQQQNTDLMFYSDRKHTAGFVLAAFITTKLTASKEIADTMKTAKTNTPTLIGVR